MKRLGLIGVGNFGLFAAGHLKSHFEIVAFDPHAKPATPSDGIRFVDLKTAASQPFVLLAVPVQDMENVLEQIAPHVRPNALVVDVCSVKEKPAALMEKILPKTVQIIGTHPLFGPQSGKDGLLGLGIILCPVRAEKATVVKLKKFLAELGLHVIEMTPAQHDEWMARTQAIAHLVGRAAKEMELPQAPFRLATYDALLALRDLVKDDSDALFDTIQNENPHAASQREKLRKKMDEIETHLIQADQNQKTSKQKKP